MRTDAKTPRSLDRRGKVARKQMNRVTGGQTLRDRGTYVELFSLLWHQQLHAAGLRLSPFTVTVALSENTSVECSLGTTEWSLGPTEWSLESIALAIIN